MTEVIYKIRVIPNSKINKLVGKADKFLKIKLTAPAVDNKANKALVEFLSDYFKKKKKDIAIIAGATSRDKLVKIN